MPAVLKVEDMTGLLLGNRAEPVAAPSEAKDMLVIGAGFPRTGTCSLQAALERLGLKSYHMKKAMLMDTDLWYEHARERQQGRTGIYPRIMDAMSEQGYTATVDNPNILYYKELMERYPKAKVILSERVKGGGESYATSVLNTIAQNAPLMKRAPFRWFEAVQKQSVIREWHMAEHGSPFDPITQQPRHEDLVSTYEEWNEKVKETVPPEKLLVFNSAEGWEPLCDFLSPLDASIKANCRQVLDNQEPYPHINDTQAMRKAQQALGCVSFLVENFPTLIVFVCLLRWMVTRSRNRKHHVSICVRKCSA